jgi:type IV pilus assembly protein PilA
MRRQAGFTLIELMIVVAIIAIIAAMAIPSILNARKASNEASATSALRTLMTANGQYQIRFRSYASSFANLSASGYLDDALGSGSKSGYNFTYAGGGDTWTTTANPVAAGSTGDRGFFVDDAGVIRFSASGPATATSPPIE